MKAKHLVLLVAALAIVFAFAGCQKKVAAPTAVPTAIVEAPILEEPVVETPTAAGAKPVEPTKDVAKIQAIDGITYTIDLIGWDNPFALTMLERVLANLEILKKDAVAPDSDVYAKAEVDLNGVGTKLDGVVKANGTLTQEELNALKETLKGVRTALKGKSPAPLSEDVGNKLKEGEAMKKKKLEAGGDLKKKKLEEGREGK